MVLICDRNSLSMLSPRPSSVSLHCKPGKNPRRYPSIRPILRVGQCQISFGTSRVIPSNHIILVLVLLHQVKLLTKRTHLRVNKKHERGGKRTCTKNRHPLG